MVPVTRLLGTILLAIVIAAAMVATIPVTTMQTAKAYTYCSRTFLTQDERYKCGYNHGYLSIVNAISHTENKISGERSTVFYYLR
jgi:hypothetical protein